MPVDYESVSISGGQLYLRQDSTDNGPQVHSKPYAVPTEGILEIKRRVKTSFANNNFRGRFHLVNSMKSELNGEWYQEGSRSFCEVTYDHDSFSAPANAFSLGNQYLPPIWDQYFDEIFTYNFASAVATYTNGNKVVTYQCEFPETEYYKIMFDTYGWYTGHETWIDSIYADVRSGDDVPEPVESAITTILPALSH